MVGIVDETEFVCNRLAARSPEISLSVADLMAQHLS
jgi:hypothetical protein